VLDGLIMDSFHHALTAFEMGYAGRATSVGFEVVLCMHCDIVRQKAPGVSIAYLKLVCPYLSPCHNFDSFFASALDTSSLLLYTFPRSQRSLVEMFLPFLAIPLLSSITHILRRFRGFGCPLGGGGRRSITAGHHLILQGAGGGSRLQAGSPIHCTWRWIGGWHSVGLFYMSSRMIPLDLWLLSSLCSA